MLAFFTCTCWGVAELALPFFTASPGRITISLPTVSDRTREASSASIALELRPTFAQSRDAYQLMGSSLTNMCVSCRKSKTVTGPRVRVSKSLRPSGVNSPLPDARSSLKPVVAGGSPLVALIQLSVVRKFRGKALASFRSISQIVTAEFASAGRTGGFLCTSVPARRAAGTSRKPNTNGGLRDEQTNKVMKVAPDWRQIFSGGQGIFTNSHSKLAIRVA